MDGFNPDADLNLEQRKQRIALASRLLRYETVSNPEFYRLKNLADDDVPKPTAHRILREAVDNGTVDKGTLETSEGEEITVYFPLDEERLERFKEVQHIDPSEVTPDIEEPEEREDSYDSSTLIPFDGELIPITEHPKYDPSASKQQNKANIFRS